MAKKLFVKDPDTGEQTPFLRGVLVQSLSAVGLSFAEAYDVAQEIRGLLEKGSEVCDKPRLRGLVGEELESRFGADVHKAYEAGKEHERRALVRTSGRDERFSVGMLTRNLEGCGIGHDEALNGAHLVHDLLRERGDAVIDHRDLRRVIYTTLKTSCCAEAADRFLSRCRFNDSAEPLIVLIGGATGAGKSTVTARLAYLLDIVRTQSTDMMREIIRCYLVPHVAPTLGYSSFEAWQGLPEVEPLVGEMVTDNPVVSGFLAQFGTVKVALEATIQRAVKERQDLIVDGVHVLPTRIDLSGLEQKAVVVPVLLAVTTIGRLEEQLMRRKREQPDRESARRREGLDGIWELQNYMIDQAEKGGIPVILNWSVDETVKQVMDEVTRKIAQRFPPDPSALG